jgi:hypothetical protein
MKHIKLSKAGAKVGILACALLGLCAFLCFAFVQQASAAAENGRLLSSIELASVFGDGTDPCRWRFSCSSGLKDGTSNCAKCGDPDLGEKYKCCNIAVSTQCEYTANTSQCSSANKWVGPVNGSYATCDSCTSASYTDSTKKCSGYLSVTLGANVCPGSP